MEAGSAHESMSRGLSLNAAQQPAPPPRVLPGLFSPQGSRSLAFEQRVRGFHLVPHTTTSPWASTAGRQGGAAHPALSPGQCNAAGGCPLLFHSPESTYRLLFYSLMPRPSCTSRPEATDSYPPDSSASAGSTSSCTPQLTMPTASSAPATTWLSVEYRKRSICRNIWGSVRVRELSLAMGRQCQGNAWINLRSTGSSRSVLWGAGLSGVGCHMGLGSGHRWRCNTPSCCSKLRPQNTAPRPQGTPAHLDRKRNATGKACSFGSRHRQLLPAAGRPPHPTAARCPARRWRSACRGPCS